MQPCAVAPCNLRSHMMCVCYALCAAGVFDVADMQLLLRWMDMLARNPKGTDDVKSVSGVLPPVQKLVLQLLGQFKMVGLALGFTLVRKVMQCTPC